MNWLHPTPDGCTVTVKVTPRAKKSEISGADPGWVRVRLQAPPVDGKANEALVELFAARFALPKRSVEILTGETSRLKRVRLRGVTPDAILAAIPHEKPLS